MWHAAVEARIPTLHSLDKWHINPQVYEEPNFHKAGLNDLDTPPGDTFLSRAQLLLYFESVESKICKYLHALREEDLLQAPAQCMYTRFHLIMAQHRHLDMHIGMLIGFVIASTGRWPRVLGLESDFPQENEQAQYF